MHILRKSCSYFLAIYRCKTGKLQSPDLGIGTTTPLATFDVRGQSGTTPVASFSGQTTNASLVINNDGVGPLLSASMSGYPRFNVKNDGSIDVGIGNVNTSGTSTTGIYLNGNLRINDYAGGQTRFSPLGNIFSIYDINNASAQQLLQVFGTSGSKAIRLTQDANAALIGSIGTNVLALQYAASGNNSGGVAIGTETPLGQTGLDIEKNVSNEALLVNQLGSGPIFTASQSSNTKFQITNGGNLKSVAGAQWLPLTDSTTALQIANAGGTAFVNLDSTNQRLGLGTTSPSYTLDVQSATAATAAAEIYNTNNGANADGLAIKLGFTGNGTVPTSQTAGNSFERYLNGNGVAQGSIDSNGLGGVTYNTNGIDFAEYFTKAPNTSFDEGDVVSLGGTDNQMATKATKAYDNKLLGIVSAHPGYVGGTPGENKVLVGLTGQLPVKVSAENGAIQAGDMLTSSNTLPGVAMKATRAGQIIAKALEGYSGQGVGTILVYVSATYADPTVQITDSGDLSVNGQVAGVNTQTNPTTLAGDTVPVQSTTGVTADQFNNLSTTVANLQSQMASQTAQLGKIDDLSKQLADLGKTVNLNQALAGISTQSAVLGASTTSNDTTIGGKPQCLRQNNCLEM